jgi:myo-inositol-hexaphosphate 3-phosphohydrolase
MENSQDSLQGLYTRMGKLERQNRFQRNALTVGLLISICVTAMGQARPARTVEAERFVLLDGKGRARITIGTPLTSGATVGTSPDEPIIWLSDAKGNDRAMITTEGLRLANEHSRPAASLTFTPNEGAKLFLYDNEGKLLFYAPEQRP